MKIKFKIHPLYYIVFFIMFITGYFKYFTLYTLIILVHELGHVFAGLILKWPIEKVTLYPFGCMTTFNKINSSFYEEFLVLIYGPLFQILFNYLYPLPYSKFILIFNLLPIYPLDGSKLLLLVLNILFSYYTSYIVIYLISIITILTLCVYNLDFLSLIILLFLLYDVYKYYKDLNMYMLYIIYDRYKNKYIFKKNNIIIGSKIYKIKRFRNNFFYIDNRYIEEYKYFSNYNLTK